MNFKIKPFSHKLPTKACLLIANCLKQLCLYRRKAVTSAIALFKIKKKKHKSKKCRILSDMICFPRFAKLQILGAGNPSNSSVCFLFAGIWIIIISYIDSKKVLGIRTIPQVRRRTAWNFF